MKNKIYTMIKPLKSTNLKKIEFKDLNSEILHFNIDFVENIVNIEDVENVENIVNVEDVEDMEDVEDVDKKNSDVYPLNKNSNVVAVTWDDTRWLVLSSSFLLIPTIYGYSKKLYSHSSLLLLTSLVSMNYWRKATYSWRRWMDLIVSKITFSVFLYNGVINTWGQICPMIFGYSGLFGIYYCFTKSEQLWKKKNNNWLNYHMGFHTLLTCELMMILNKYSTKYI